MDLKDEAVQVSLAVAAREASTAARAAAPSIIAAMVAWRPSIVDHAQV
jgi:hypothetical protein